MRLFALLPLFLVASSVSAQSFVEVQKVFASDRWIQDYFGSDVAISGNYAVVGAPTQDSGAAGPPYLFASGAAYVYQWTGSAWVLQQKLVAADRKVAAYFGTSVAISGTRILIGAPWDKTDANDQNSINKAGAAYFFELNGGVWNQVQKVVPSDRGGTSDEYATTVALAGDYAMIGSIGEDEDTLGLNPLTDAGAVYVLERIGGVWTEVQKLIASDRTTSMGYGEALDVDQNGRAVIGAWRDGQDTAAGPAVSLAGSAYVYERNVNGKWRLVNKIISNDRDANDHFGRSVAISGDWIVVAALGEDYDESGGNFRSNAGAVYTFIRNSSKHWTLQQKLVGSDRQSSDQYGYDVRMSGDVIIVGAPSHDRDAAGASFRSDAGAAYILKRTGPTTWTQTQKLVPVARNQDDQFGYAVGIDGNRAIGGAINHDLDTSGNLLNQAGAAFIFNECQNTADSVTRTACDSLIAPSGKVLKTAGIFRDTIPNQNGCDSIITINLSLGYSSSDSITLKGCGIVTSPSGKSWFNSGNYMDTIPNAQNCDSIIFAHVVIGLPTSSQVSDTACDSLVSPSGKYTWYTSGLHHDTVKTSTGCDSTIQFQLTIGTETKDSVAITACSSLKSPSGKYVWTTSGDYLDTIPNASGCDSILCITATIHHIDTSVTLTIPTPGNGVLSANQAGGNYQWVDCDQNYAPIAGETQQNFSPTANGRYAVIIIMLGCADTSGCHTVNVAGIEEHEVNFAPIWPNPASTTVHFSGMADGQLVKVMTASGQVAAFLRVQAEQLDITSLPSGHYVVQWVVGDGIGQARLVVE